jgi:hypothetical protein
MAALRASETAAAPADVQISAAAAVTAERPARGASERATRPRLGVPRYDLAGIAVAAAGIAVAAAAILLF